MQLDHVQLDILDSLVPGQYFRIGDAPHIYIIVKVTQATVVITPGASVDGIPVGAAIEIEGVPTGVETAEAVAKGGTTVTLSRADALTARQSITFAGGAAVYTIVKVDLAAIDIVNYYPPGALPGALAAVDPRKAIAFSLATFSTFGEVVNIGNSTSYALDTLLTRADRYVTVTATGTFMTLPTSPADGQMHSIKSGALVTTTVNTADGLTIDGGPSAPVLPSQNVTFRYSDSAAIKQWEVH